jgi:hydroxyethylthiazole kinase-like uncharacterized protein yjeF
MILSAGEMRALEEAAFRRGISAEALMDQAGHRAALAIREFFPAPGVCLAVFGKGNNGGDALVAARHLASAGWETHLVPCFPGEHWNELVRKKYSECGLAHHHEAGQLAQSVDRLANLTRPMVVLDGILGVGAHGPLRGAVADAARGINRLRDSAYAHVFALDLPTGLDADSGDPSEECVRADFTLAIGAAKRGLLADGASSHVGRLVVVPLDELPAGPETDACVATPALLASLLPRRPYETHKGNCGRVAIVAGSVGMSGAAVLCSEACVRAGAGLVRLYVPGEAYDILATTAAPEVMVKRVSSYAAVLEDQFNVLALGPGLGRERAGEVLELIRTAEAPAVIDADGLNILSGHLELLASGHPRLLTPHPVEMQRLAGDSTKKLTRSETVRAFTEKHRVTLLLKGARTVIGEAGRPLSYNPTGNPGMASGGMGDVLTGVCAALAAQGLAMYDAARVGAWLCGRAAEIAVLSGEESEESFTARSVLRYLGRAFHALRGGWV